VREQGLLLPPRASVVAPDRATCARGVFVLRQLVWTTTDRGITSD